MIDTIRHVVAILRRVLDCGRAPVANHADLAPLYISCVGRVEYPEDDPVFGTYCMQDTRALGECRSIPAAIAIAERRFAQDDFPSDDEEALRFWPDLFSIADDKQRRVLVGQVWGNAIRWCPPVTSDNEADEVKAEVECLRTEASFEAGWDNHETARQLRLRAAVHEGRLVDPVWRNTVRAALQQEA